jgi:hypothetical protein
MLAFRALRDGDGKAPATAGRGARRRVNPIMEALRITAEELGDTVAVTRNSYVHPGVLAAYDPDAASAGGQGERAGAHALPGEGTAAAPRPRRSSAEPDRDDELELLALLRRSSRSRPRAQGSGATRARKAAASGTKRPTGAARRSQVAKARVADRPRPPAA